MRIPNPRDYMANWRTSDLPLAKKLQVAAKNNLIKAKNRTYCCGNYGEPGC